MREIKFRAWKKSESRMVEWEEMVRYENSLLRDILTGIWLESVMQYTGLKDKNGKEIYEGDLIVRTYSWDNVDTKKEPRIVEFKAGCFGERPVNPENVHEDDREWNPISDFEYRGNEQVPDNLEVIGNIYENPELLEDK